MLRLDWCMQEVFRAVLYAELDFERPPWDAVSAECRQLVQSLLQRDPAKRPTAAQALNHRYSLPYFTSKSLMTGAKPFLSLWTSLSQTCLTWRDIQGCTVVLVRQ